jgi:hypothetical protein
MINANETMTKVWVVFIEAFDEEWIFGIYTSPDTAASQAELNGGWFDWYELK